MSLNLRLTSKTLLRRRSIMALSEKRHHCIKHRKHPPPRSTHETKNDHVKAALSPASGSRTLGRSPPQCPCERTRSSSTLPIHLPTTHRCSHTQLCMQASPSGVSDRSATNKSHISPKPRAAKKADLMASNPSLRRRLIKGGRQREKREKKERTPPPRRHHHISASSSPNQAHRHL